MMMMMIIIIYNSRKEWVNGNSKEGEREAKEKVWAKLECLEGWRGGGGANQKSLHGVRGMDIFRNHRIIIITVFRNMHLDTSMSPQYWKSE